MVRRPQLTEIIGAERRTCPTSMPARSEGSPRAGLLRRRGGLADPSRRGTIPGFGYHCNSLGRPLPHARRGQGERPSRRPHHCPRRGPTRSEWGIINVGIDAQNRSANRSATGTGPDRVLGRRLRHAGRVPVEGHAAPCLPIRSSSRVRQRANAPDRDLGRPDHFWAGRAPKTCGESEVTFDPGRGMPPRARNQRIQLPRAEWASGGRIGERTDSMVLALRVFRRVLSVVGHASLLDLVHMIVGPGADHGDCLGQVRAKWGQLVFDLRWDTGVDGALD